MQLTWKAAMFLVLFAVFCLQMWNLLVVLLTLYFKSTTGHVCGLITATLIDFLSACQPEV